MLKELWDYFKERKKFWLIPIVLIIVLMGALMIFGLVTGLSPFIYPLF